VCLNWFELAEAITVRAGRLASLPRISLAMPSARYASLVSPKFSNGSTANRVGPALPASTGTAARLCPREASTAAPPTIIATSSTPAFDRTDVNQTASADDDAPADDVKADDLVAGSASAAANFAAEPNRSAGTLASAFNTTASMPMETVSRTVRSGRGFSVNRRVTMAWAVGPVNGGSPASIS
jgi:hypothetical protein